MEFRLRPTGDFILSGNILDILELTLQWEVRISQIIEETKFLQVVSEDFSSHGLSGKLVDELTILIQKNELLESRIRMVASKIAMHIVHLEELLEKVYYYDEQEFRVKHERLEKVYAGVVIYFRSNKKNFFSAISS